MCAVGRVRLGHPGQEALWATCNMVSNLNSPISNGVLTDENLMQNVEQPPHWHLSKTYKSKRHKTALYIGCRLIWYSSRTHFPPCLHSPNRTLIRCLSSDMMLFKPQWHLWLKLSCTVGSFQGIDAEYRTNSISSVVLCACGYCRTVITVCYFVMECWIHHWLIFLCVVENARSSLQPCSLSFLLCLSSTRRCASLMFIMPFKRSP